MLSNIVMGVLLIFCGVNVALGSLPSWMQAVGRCLPLTHGIEAAREVAAGAGWSDVSGLVGTEAMIGVVYLVFGMLLLTYFERESRRTASLERV